MMCKLAASAAAAALACAPTAASAQSAFPALPQFKGAGGVAVAPGLAAVVGADSRTGAPCLVGVAPACRLPAADTGDASYVQAVAITIGGAATAASRGVAADCTGAGVATLILAGGGALSWTLAPGHQNQPYSITAVPASTAACSFWSLY